MTEQLYGRDRLVDEVARAEAPFTLLTGDSGVGKTRVLEAASQDRPGWVCSTPRAFAASAGSVQQAVLEALAEVIVKLAADRTFVRQVGERLAGATTRFLNEGAKELGRVLAAELLEIVRGRLGPNFGKALQQYVTTLKEEIDDTVAARLAAAAHELTADVLASLAFEVVALSGDRRIALFFDTGERLSEEEGRLLIDLSERLPERCHVRVAFATYGGPVSARVAELRLLASASFEIEVLSLDDAAVAAWLADSGVDAELAAVMKATAAIRYLSVT
jgi:hypothetical protein